jgi:molybdopterin-containing oxidoreductase family membrane subunit
MATIANKQRTANDLPWLVGLGVLAVIGLAAWLVQLVLGFDVLGVNQAVVWGAYIAAFFLLAGTGSGLVITAALGDLEVLPAMKAHRRAFLLGAIASFIAAGLVILMDIGKPERVINMILSANFGSMFVWDFFSLAASVVVAAAYLWWGPKVKWLPGVALVVAGLVVIVEGWILAVSAGRPLWHNALLPVVFLGEGLITALAVALLVWAKGEAEEKARGLLVALLPAVLILSLLELVSVSFRGTTEALDGLNLLVSGSLAPFYWGQIVLGIALPFVLLVWAAKNQMAVMAAAALAIIGVFVAKLDLLVAGQALPFMGAPVSYIPTLVEIAGVIGMVGLAAFLYVLADRLVPVKGEA